MAEEKPKSERPKITWDEEVIEAHNKERGTRMKICEPDTPYIYYNAENDSAESATGEYAGAPKHTPPNPAGTLDFNELSKKLSEVKNSSESNVECITVNMSDVVEKPKNKDFLKKRKAHYNEYQMMKQLKNMTKDEDED